jgi:hypothetical protein
MINIRNNLVNEEQLEKLVDSGCSLLTSKQLAKVLHCTDAALRKQRSKKGRNLLPYAKLGRSVLYPLDLVMKVIHENVRGAQLR